MGHILSQGQARVKILPVAHSHPGGVGQVNGGDLIQLPSRLQSGEQLLQRGQPGLLLLGHRQHGTRLGGQNGQPGDRQSAAPLRRRLQQLAAGADEPGLVGQGLGLLPLCLGAVPLGGAVRLPAVPGPVLRRRLCLRRIVLIDLHLGGGGDLRHLDGEGAGQPPLGGYLPHIGQPLQNLLADLVFVHLKQVVADLNPGGVDDLLGGVAAVAHHRDGLHLKKDGGSQGGGGHQGRPAQQLEQQAEPPPTPFSFSVVPH